MNLIISLLTSFCAMRQINQKDSFEPKSFGLIIRLSSCPSLVSFAVLFLVMLCFLKIYGRYIDVI